MKPGAAPEPGGAPARLPGIVLEIPSATEFLSLVRGVAQRAARLAGFDPAVGEQIALAVDECATNVIEHAYQGASDRRIELRFEHRGLELRVEVLDSGAPIDPQARPQVDLQRYAAERRTGGLGVHLMEKIMDSVSFERQGQRNLCCLRRRKAAPELDS